MTTAQHTPGPWVCWHSETDACGTPSNVTVFKVETKTHVDLFSEADANARLIADAPRLFDENIALKTINTKLLEALEAVKAWDESHSRLPRDLWQIVRGAIAKAGSKSK